MRMIISLLCVLVLAGCTTTSKTESTVNIANQADLSASSTQVKWDGEGPVEVLVDGDLQTRWSSQFADSSVKNPDRQKDDKQSVTLDFKQAISFSRVSVHWEAAAARDYTLLTSDDGKTWQTLETYGNGAVGPRVDNLAPGKTKARYLRLAFSARASEYGYSIYEIQVY